MKVNRYRGNRKQKVQNERQNIRSKAEKSVKVHNSNGVNLIAQIKGRRN